MSGDGPWPKPDMEEVDEVDFRRYAAQKVFPTGGTAFHDDLGHSAYGHLTGGNLFVEPHKGGYDGSHSGADDHFRYMYGLCAQRRPTR